MPWVKWLPWRFLVRRVARAAADAGGLARKVARVEPLICVKG